MALLILGRPSENVFSDGLTTTKNGGRAYWYKNLVSISLTYMKLRQLVRLATSVKRKPFHRG